jgi:cytosine permease
MNLNPAAFVAWVVGFLAGFYIGGNELFSGLLSSLFAAGLVYYTWMRLARARGTTPEIQLFGAKGDSQ